MNHTGNLYKNVWAIAIIVIIFGAFNFLCERKIEPGNTDNNQTQRYIQITRLWSSYIKDKLENINGVQGATVFTSISKELSSETKISILIKFNPEKPDDITLKTIKKVFTDHLLFPIHPNNIAISDQSGQVIQLF